MATRAAAPPLIAPEADPDLAKRDICADLAPRSSDIAVHLGYKMQVTDDGLAGLCAGAIAACAVTVLWPPSFAACGAAVGNGFAATACAELDCAGEGYGP